MGQHLSAFFLHIWFYFSGPKGRVKPPSEGTFEWSRSVGKVAASLVVTAALRHSNGSTCNCLLFYDSSHRPTESRSRTHIWVI